MPFLPRLYYVKAFLFHICPPGHAIGTSAAVRGDFILKSLAETGIAQGAIPGGGGASTKHNGRAAIASLSFHFENIRQAGLPLFSK